MKRVILVPVLALALCAASASGAADDKAPPKSDPVTYPMNPGAQSSPAPIFAPAPATGGDAAGKWAETEDSPALRVSRAWVKLGQAADVERSEATHKLYASWRNAVAQDGQHSRSTQAAHAQFLAAYKNDLEAAKKIYEGVLREVDAMDTEEGGKKPDQQPAVSLSKEATEALATADRDDRLSNAACFLSPDNCVQIDPTDKALQDEISGLLKDTLEAGGPDGSLSLYSLRRKAGLLALRARVMAAITQRAAVRLATEVATATDGQGGTRALMSPVSPMASSARRSTPQLSDPYR
jgi:hypothetical protein